MHDLHPPDEVRIFSVPDEGVRRRDDGALVYDLRVGSGLASDLVLRHYAFADRWFAVNCTLDLGGAFVAERGPIDWCFSCDVTTPLVMAGTDALDVDLFLDVLVAPNGRDHVAADEEGFDEAIRRGWLTEDEILGARAGLADLLDLCRSESLVPFLEAVCPFAPVADAPIAPPMVRRRPDDVPLLGRVVRGRPSRRRRTDGRSPVGRGRARAAGQPG